MNATAGQIHEVAAGEVFGLLRSRTEGLAEGEMTSRRRDGGG